MPRLSNKQLRQRNNKGSHQRKRTTRGKRFISKLKKYKWYETINSKRKEVKDNEKFILVRYRTLSIIISIASRISVKNININHRRTK